jgi:hypothetical protein
MREEFLAAPHFLQYVQAAKHLLCMLEDRQFVITDK